LWKVRVLQKHPRQMSVRQFVPPLFVAALLVTGVAAPWIRAAAWLWGAGAGAYVLADAAASATLARREGWGQFAPLLLVFATMHFSWGSGFLLGAARFAGRWFVDEPRPPQLQAAVPAAREWARASAGE